jgi:formylmethanofuran dehydrogenase subunit E
LMTKGETLERRDEMDVMAAAYSKLPESDLLNFETVQVNMPDWDLPGPPRYKAFCVVCGEKILDHRETVKNGVVVCRACAEKPYYSVNETSTEEVACAGKNR